MTNRSAARSRAAASSNSPTRTPFTGAPELAFLHTVTVELGQLTYGIPGRLGRPRITVPEDKAKDGRVGRRSGRPRYCMCARSSLCSHLRETSPRSSTRPFPQVWSLRPSQRPPQQPNRLLPQRRRPPTIRPSNRADPRSQARQIPGRAHRIGMRCVRAAARTSKNEFRRVLLQPTMAVERSGRRRTLM
jgi:hypothetical protein